MKEMNKNTAMNRKANPEYMIYEDTFHSFVDVGEVIGKINMESFNGTIKAKVIEARTLYEEAFLANIKALDLHFDANNVIMLGNLDVPIYLKFVASLGRNFSYIPGTRDITTNSILICLSKIEDTINDFEGYQIFKDMKKETQNFNQTQPNTQPSKQQLFIAEQLKLSLKFLHQNQRIIVTMADKGGKSVITTKYLYEEKMEKFIQDGVKGRIFFPVKLCSIEVRKYIENKYQNLREKVNPFLKEDASKGYKHCCHQLKFEPYVMARIYGLFKIHKAGTPIRPIVSTINCVGDKLSEWLLHKLEIISKFTSKHKVRNSFEAYALINGQTIEEDYILATMDFDNMYTNIPFGKVKKLIREFYYLIENETTMPINVFLEALSFFIEDDAYFSFNHGIFRQCNGLSMGNKLSQVLAEIFISVGLQNVFSRIPADSKTRLMIYIDDLLTICHKHSIDDLRSEIMKECGGINLKLEIENEQKEVNFLNMEISNFSGKIITKWWQKPQSSDRILDYHSYHPRNMKLNIIEEYLRNALRITSPIFWDITTKSVRIVLRNSNYPKKLIRETIRKVRNDIGGTIERKTLIERGQMTKSPRSKSELIYIAAPFHPNILQDLKKLLKMLGIKNVRISPACVRKNKTHLFSNLKDKRDLGSTIHSKFKIKCENCDFEHNAATSNLDVERTLSHLRNRINAEPYRHIIKHPDHQLFVDTGSVRKFKSNKELCRLD